MSALSPQQFSAVKPEDPYRNQNPAVRRMVDSTKFLDSRRADDHLRDLLRQQWDRP